MEHRIFIYVYRSKQTFIEEGHMEQRFSWLRPRNRTLCRAMPVPLAAQRVPLAEHRP